MVTAGDTVVIVLILFTEHSDRLLFEDTPSAREKKNANATSTQILQPFRISRIRGRVKG